MTILVMHLLLIRVLEGFAVATVSIQTTHTYTCTQAHAHTNIWRDEYRTIVEHLYH